jgi:hypothetical protein
MPPLKSRCVRPPLHKRAHKPHNDSIADAQCSTKKTMTSLAQWPQAWLCAASKASSPVAVHGYKPPSNLIVQPHMMHLPFLLPARRLSARHCTKKLLCAQIQQQGGRAEHLATRPHCMPPHLSRSRPTGSQSELRSAVVQCAAPSELTCWRASPPAS